MGLIKPKNGESQSEFLARAHQLLKSKYPDASERSSYALKCWRDVYGETSVEKKSKQMFPSSEFVLRENVPIFAEHETTDSQGNAQKYDRDALMKIIDKCNSRIEDTGDAAALTEGHTPDRDDVAKGAKQPDVLGFVGPFRLGQIGEKNPRYAILADEFYFKDVAPKVKRLPRRSVELWMSPEMEERFVDPIAALGAEAPRLDLGLRFARNEHDQLVEKYSGPAAPAGSNTFLLGDESGKKKQDYENKETTRMLSPEEVKQIVDAVDSLDWVQWAKSQMSAGQTPDETASDETLTDNSAPVEDAPAIDAPPEDAEVEQYDEAPEEEIPAPMAEDVPADIPADVPADIAADIPADVPPVDEPVAELPEEEDEEEYAGLRYSAEEGQEEKEEEEEEAVPYSRRGYKDRYRAARNENSKLARKLTEEKSKYHKLRSEVAGIKRQAVDSDRVSQLERYRLEYSFDLEKEKDRCLLSRGSKMSDESFDDHLSCMVENYRRIPHSQTLPPGQLPELSDRDRYEKKISDLATQYAAAERKAGRRCSWQQALSHVRINNPETN